LNLNENKLKMGIPSFFRTIIQKNPSLLSGASSFTNSIDYFFIDFNSIIYHSFHQLQKQYSSQLQQSIDPSIIKEQMENQLIESIINTLSHLVNDIVKPKVYAYISIDGVAPRAKMVQQRSRRYKSVQWKELLRKKEVELQIQPSIEWDPSPNISPGTIFMKKLQRSILHHMKIKKFQYKTYLNDSNHRGEGEHKFLPLIRSFQDPTKKIVIYSPDGDMISLALLTHQPHIYIMRIPDSQSPLEAKFIPSEKYIYCDCDQLRQLFYTELTKTYSENVNELNVLNDYNFLLAMVGNDFIPSLPFLKIRAGGLDLLIQIYNQLRPQFSDYLIQYHPKDYPNPTINMDFFTAFIEQLSICEQKEMIREHQKIVKDQHHPRHHFRVQKEMEMTPLEIFSNRYQHLNFFHPDHPEYSQNISLLSTINYKSSSSIWKSQYYHYFFNPNLTDVIDQPTFSIIQNYFESLVFTLHYYLKGCPSYSWYYKYRVSPLPSDMLTILNQFSFNLNTITFTDSYQYTPFAQLLLILPPQMSFLLPPILQEYMHQSNFYKSKFEVDKLAGLKYIYSEAILPELEDDDILQFIKSKEHLFTKEEKERNQVHSKLFTFRSNS